MVIRAKPVINPLTGLPINPTKLCQRSTENQTDTKRNSNSTSIYLSKNVFLILISRRLRNPKTTSKTKIELVATNKEFFSKSIP